MLKYPSHPGEILNESVLPYHGLSQSEAAAILNVEGATLEAILAGRAPISRDLAEQIEAAWGVSADLLVNIQRNYDAASSRRRRGMRGFATIIVVAMLALAGIAWQAANLWRMLT